MTVMKGQKQNGLYSLVGSTFTCTSAVGSQPEQDKTRLWHMRLGHLSERGLKELSNQSLVCGDLVGKLEFCEHCIVGKQTRLKFNVGLHTSSGTLDYVHSDVWGPTRLKNKLNRILKSKITCKIISWPEIERRDNLEHLKDMVMLK
ncbi:hypothetical protein UlMin_041182 [Ulmus minor]